MSDAVVKYARARAPAAPEPRRPSRSPQEQRALDVMRSEARAYGVKLVNDGEGGLPSSLVLSVFRRDRYACKRHGGRERPITVHHKGGIVESRWLDSKGHKNEPNNLVTVCNECHDVMHDEAREKGVDSSQVTPSGDRHGS